MKPPEAKRAKLQLSSPQTSPTQPESEVWLGPHCSDAVDNKIVSLPCQSCSGLSVSSNGRDAGTASSISPREIKESPSFPVATVTEAIDQSGAEPGLNKDEEKEQHLKLIVGDSPMSHFCRVQQKSENLIFSPEQSDEEKNLISTQINRQIERVEKFLKTDRLRRPKKLTDKGGTNNSMSSQLFKM